MSKPKSIVGHADIIRLDAIEACAKMASSNRIGTDEPATCLADAIDVESPAGEIAVQALQAAPVHFRRGSKLCEVPQRERWAAAEQLLQCHKLKI